MAEHTRPDVSVIIPVHNGACFLEQALASIAGQDVSDDGANGVGVEVVVVDDGSDDESAEIAARLGATVLRQANLGPAAARNAGVARSRGRRLAFLDADDMWTEDKLSFQLDRLDRGAGCGITLGCQDLIIENGSSPAWVSEPPAWMPFEWRSHASNHLVLASMLVDRTVFDRIGLFDEELRHSEDVDWMLRAMEAGEKIDFTEHVLLRRRVHADNASGDESGMRKGMLQALAKRAARHRARAEGGDTDRAAQLSVAVVIPVRGHTTLLADALASVKAQTRKPEQVVVIDDGSGTDLSALQMIVAESGPGNCRLISQPPLGAAAARNLGARLCSTTHLLFLDADDRLATDAVETLVTGLGAPADPLAVSGRVAEFIDQPVEGLRAPRTERVRLLGAMLFPRATFDELDGFDESLQRGEAMDLIHRAVATGLPVAEVDDVVLQRRLHSANGGRGNDNFDDYLLVARLAIERARGPGNGDR